MGCKFSKVKGKKKKNESISSEVNRDVDVGDDVDGDDDDNDELQIYRYGGSASKRSIKGECEKDCKSQTNEMACKSIIDRHVPSSGKEWVNRKSGRMHSQVDVKKKGKREDTREGEMSKEVTEEVEDSSFAGIINTINNTFLKRKCASESKNKKVGNFLKIEKRTIWGEKKIKFLDKNEEEKCTNINGKNGALSDYYNYEQNSKKEKILYSTVKKNKELLLYYHDFRSMKLKKNTFLHIYELYRYNCNSFNLFSLMPSHIAENVHASKILFESSLIGKYIILPWIENDPDIKNNLYVKYVQLSIENKKGNTKKKAECTSSKEVNFCGFFHHNIDYNVEDTKKMSKGKITQGRNCYPNTDMSKHSEEKKVPGDANKNPKKEKQKRKKYVKNVNLSMDNLLKLYRRGSPTRRRNVRGGKKNEQIGVEGKAENAETLGKAVKKGKAAKTGKATKATKVTKAEKNSKTEIRGNENNGQNNGQNNEDHNFKQSRGFLNGKHGKTGEIKQRSEVAQLEKKTSSNSKMMEENVEESSKINKNIKREHGKAYANELHIRGGGKVLNGLNVINGVPNGPYGKLRNGKNYAGKDSPNNKMGNANIQVSSPVIHTKKEEAIKIMKIKKKIIKSSFPLGSDAAVTRFEEQPQLIVDDGKRVNTAKGTSIDQVNKRVILGIVKNKRHVTQCHVEGRNEKGEERCKSKELCERKIEKKGVKTDGIAITNGSNKTVNLKGVKRIQKKVQLHAMPYEQIFAENRKKVKGKGHIKEDGNQVYLSNWSNVPNRKGGDKTGHAYRVEHSVQDDGENEKKRNLSQSGGENGEAECHHKYRLSENCIKRNYVLCKKCRRKRCIFHYINDFKLYGWIDFKWTDPDGFLELSIRQKKKFHAWKRLSDLYSNPIVMSTNLYNNCIRQGFVADCSFLSSLTVLIEYEKKHKVPVLSSIISPCTSNYLHVNRTWPIFNPSGMYICRLHCNGIQRKIIIDDYVPVKNNNALLVAYSNNQKELWVTLLEKAFVKLMGGSYSMFGSNPGSDLYYLTGWIPVTISLKSKISSSPPSLDRSTMHSSPNNYTYIKKKGYKIKNKKHKNMVEGVRGEGSKISTHSIGTKNEQEGSKNEHFFTREKKDINKGRRMKKKNISQVDSKGRLSRKRNHLKEENQSFYRCRANMIYTDSSVNGSNLDMYRLYEHFNYSHFRNNFLIYEKLKIFWSYREMYISQRENIKREGKKKKDRRRMKKEKCREIHVCNRNDLIEEKTQVKDSFVSMFQKKCKFERGNWSEQFSTERHSMGVNVQKCSPLQTPVMGSYPTGAINANFHKHTWSKEKGGGKKIGHKGGKDYEMKRRNKIQFLNEEVSSMDLSSYVCGSIDQYSYVHKKGDSSVLLDDNDEYDERWDIIWNNMYDGIKKGKCVVCLGTLELKDAAPSGLDYPEGVSISTGIVTRHAYSILNIETYNGDKLLYIKNPWGCIRWKGKYSHHDEETWSKEVQKKLNYSIERAKGKDDGCFWIPWKDVVKYFSHIYICWNSVIFPYQFEIHTKWENSTLLKNSTLLDDTHLVAYNPQFALHVNVRKQDLSEDGLYYIGKKPIEVWILLSRHVRERKTDVSQKYLALHIHAGKDRIICPLFPIKQGVYSNGECTFTKLIIGGEESYTEYDKEGKRSKRGTTNSKGGGIGREGGNDLNFSQENEQETLRNLDFVIIVSQYSQKEEFNFTLKVFSHTHLSLYELPPLLPDNYESLYFEGKWTSKCAGGCSNNLWSYFKNPHIRLYVPEDTCFCIFLECSQEYSVNLRIFKGLTSSPRSLKKGEIISSGAYKAGCCYIECTLERGTYCLIPSLYRENITGAYQLCIHYPKMNKKPALYFIPYSYITPPLSYFNYELVHLCSIKNYSVILFHTISITLLSLRITLIQNKDIRGIPFVNIYKLVSKTDSLANDLECGNIIKSNSFNSVISFNSFVYRIVQKCNIHGGPGNDILPLSTCAYDYYIKFNSVLIPLVELENDCTSYLLLITTNIKEDILHNHQVHFVSDKPVIIDNCYPLHS
ncbi:calpain, putative (Pcalp) [Plasmodium ovale wallikeri]|uniref:Calpain, putative (Pcalp) n=1 Tax=Plasmodium ovale wallikeri TaxID=864142 RepID=A0A1A8YZB7_PLAOA|nr:calpain, putative (Pcalp) [Plasmodium ovale wallikeri]SBT37642.1 calpain, putative (Pcalp) [Plasmodium ovale wallikeri]